MRKRGGKRDYSQIAHQHILVSAPGSSYRSLMCVYNGCKYSEYWDGKQYRAYGPATRGRPDTAAERKASEQEQKQAIRPHGLWGELQS